MMKRFFSLALASALALSLTACGGSGNGGTGNGTAAPADTPEHRTEYIEKDFSRLCMLALTIEHVTGKQARELVPAAQ